MTQVIKDFLYEVQRWAARTLYREPMALPSPAAVALEMWRSRHK